MVMLRMVRESQEICAKEPFMEPMLRGNVLRHTNFASALAFMLARKFGAHDDYTVEDWENVFTEVFSGKLGPYEPHLGEATHLAANDLQAVPDRDAACTKMVAAFLFYKGFHAIQVHRVAHVLWRVGRQFTALLLQSRCSELWGVDVHPAATIGSGLLIDHATGIVMGETAVVGNDCSFLHGVTLGGTGKEGCGDRHPKIGDNVLVGCNATLLGNVHVGSNCKIGSGTMLLKDTAPGVTVVGNPARLVGVSMCKHSGQDMDHALASVVTASGHRYSTEQYEHEIHVALPRPPRSRSSAMLSSLSSLGP